MAYLDATAGRPLHPEAVAAYQQAAIDGFADPSRQHREGARARLLRNAAHDALASALGVPRDHVTVHSSRTAAVRFAVAGLAAGSGVAPTALVGAADHSDVLHAADAVVGQRLLPGATPPAVLTDIPSATRFGVDERGCANVDELGEHLRRGRWSFVATQTANQEVGTRQPLSVIAGLCHGAGAPLLIDASATAAWEPLPDVGDVLVADAAQWGGPRSIGIVVVRPGVRFRPPEIVRPSAIPDVPAIVAAATALDAARRDSSAVDRASTQIARIRAQVAAIPDIDLVGDPDHRAPHIVTMSFLYVAGEAIVTELDRRGFSVGSGSACSSDTLEPSHVLAAMGALTHGNVRIALSPDTSDDEVDRFLAVLPVVVDELRGTTGLSR